MLHLPLLLLIGKVFMRFKLFLETDEATLRQQLFQRYIQIISFDGQAKIAPDYINHLQQYFNTTPIDEIEKRIKADEVYAQQDRRRWEIEQEAAKRKQFNLAGKYDNYERVNDTFERFVCSDGNPEFEKKGMPAFAENVTSHDPKLKGYYGVHCGGAWLPILIRDGYCDSNQAYHYEIDTEPFYNSKKPFYVMEDYHINDKTNTPNSVILFSKNKIIPANLIRLVEIIDTTKVKPAPDPY